MIPVHLFLGDPFSVLPYRAAVAIGYPFVSDEYEGKH